MLADKKSFWAFESTFWMNELSTSRSGLTDEQVQKRKQTEKNVPTNANFKKDIILFLNQFKSPLMLLLIFSVLVSAFLGDNSDVFIILFIVLSTGIVSFFQERNANNTVAKLQQLIATKSSVIRSGKTIKIDNKDVVSGDIIEFHAGDIVPADCLLLETNELQVNESSLTGESFPVRKNIGLIELDSPLNKRNNCLWEGTSIISGKALAIAIHTGKQTILGSMMESVNHIQETSFEQGLKGFGYMLMKFTLGLCVFILCVNLFNHKPVIESALFALALAVGMAPELLPAISTIAMSAGAKRLLDKKVIVKKLNSIQNLGEVDLLCTDKTGTITEGIIKVNSFVNAWNHEDEWVKSIASWNAKLQSGYSNAIDDAILEKSPIQENCPEKIAEIPYDFKRKRIGVAVKVQSSNYLISKGAFKEVLEICKYVRQVDGTIQLIEKFNDQIENLFVECGNKGMRTIAVAYKNMDSSVVNISLEDESEMIFAGFILMIDPVKNDIQSVIDDLKSLKVGLKIITGDNKIVAQSIAKQLGIESPKVLTGKELWDMSDEVLSNEVVTTNIFSEVEPQQKERIILSLKKSFTVAYMGDGINDVAAINAADVGISVDNAVDVARSAADFILLEKTLSVLVEGIKEGRKTFSNTLKYIYINTGSTFGNMLSVTFASILLPFLPMLPKQILLTNFISDLPFLSIPSDSVDEEQMSKPGRWNIHLIKKYMLYFGIHSSLFDLLTFVLLFKILQLTDGKFQTSWFTESILTELLLLFVIRTRKSFFKSKPAKMVVLLSTIGVLVTILLPFLPFASDFGFVRLSGFQLGLMLGIVIIYIITADLLKVWFFKKYGNE